MTREYRAIAIFRVATLSVESFIGFGQCFCLNHTSVTIAVFIHRLEKNLICLILVCCLWYFPICNIANAIVCRECHSSSAILVYVIILRFSLSSLVPSLSV